VESAEEGGFSELWFWPDSSGAAMRLLRQSGESERAEGAPGGWTTTRGTTLKVDGWTDAVTAVERRARPGDSPAFS